MIHRSRHRNHQFRRIASQLEYSSSYRIETRCCRNTFRIHRRILLRHRWQDLPENHGLLLPQLLSENKGLYLVQ